MSAGTFAPQPGAAPLGRMLGAQTANELRLTLRRGESVLLTLVIPLGLLVAFTVLPIVGGSGVGHTRAERAAFFVPGVLALAIMSTAFTGQAIATGYERHYGVLKRLGATPLPRGVLLLAKTAGVVAVELLQVLLIVVVGIGLGWRPHAAWGAVVLLVVLGTAAFSGLGLLMAGTLRAEVTLAGANLVWFVLLVCGGVLFPLSAFGTSAAHALEWTPTAALSTGLRAAMSPAAHLVTHTVVALAVWAVALLAAAARTFRWE